MVLLTNYISKAYYNYIETRGGIMKLNIVLLICIAFTQLFAVTNIDESNLHSPGENTFSSTDNHCTIDNRYVLYYQIPDTLTAIGYRCQLDTVWPDEADIVDDIAPTGNGWQIDSVVAWFGNWNGFSSWDPVPNIHFLVYGDSVGQPADSPMVELIIQQGEYTAVLIAYERWRVDMRLPAPVILEADKIYWIEIQPCCVWMNAGFTGNQAQVGIGNGQDFYMRYPEIGWPSWQSATQLFGQPLETGFMLYGEVIGGYHDVGTQEILAPPEHVIPGSMIDPEAKFRNHGDSSETFDVHFVIDSTGTNVYHELQNISIEAGIDTNIVFPTWTTVDSGNIVYDITVYTVLADDENPANDTLISTTTTINQIWKIYDDLPKNTYDNALVYTDATGVPEVYSLGGRGAYGEIFKFDCSSESWDTLMTTLIIPVWMTGGAVVDDKIYAIGGAEGMTFNAVDYNQEFDPITNTVTLKAPLSTARFRHGVVTWRDTLIYVMGGMDGAAYYEDVEIYDPANNSWTTGSQLPMPNSNFACGISGDIIYIAGGSNAPGNYISEAWQGIINPVSPENITWTAIPDIPVGPSGQPGRTAASGAVCDGRFHITAGYDNGFYASDAWYYDPDDNAWFQVPDKPTAAYACGAVYVPVLDGGTFFCAGGCFNNAGVYATEGLTNITLAVKEFTTNQILTGIGFVNMPNPVKSNNDITYTIANACFVKLKVYNSVGRIVKTLVNSFQPGGTYTVRWDIAGMANGVYFLRLESETQTATQKIVLVK